MNQAALKSIPTHKVKADLELLLFCKATADKLRLDILKVLGCDSYGVLELTRIIDCKQSAMSHHLKILLEAGLVARRREGNSLFYRRAHASQAKFSGMMRELFTSLEDYPLEEGYQERLQIIQNERTEQARRFFEEHAGTFSKHQEQVVAYELYGPHASELIEASFLSSPKKPQAILEIGPGEGQFLEPISRIFKTVHALDISSEMLASARDFSRSKKLDNVIFHEGDTSLEALKAHSFDAVVMNMVLHHVPSPSKVLADISALLKPGDMLFITELCEHAQDWVKSSCGDLWLGFEPEELKELAGAADFAEAESMYLAQRNGFRVQFRQFIKTNQIIDKGIQGT